jgi:hypothetical protein
VQTALRLANDVRQVVFERNTRHDKAAENPPARRRRKGNKKFEQKITKETKNGKNEEEFN